MNGLDKFKENVNAKAAVVSGWLSQEPFMDSAVSSSSYLSAEHWILYYFLWLSGPHNSSSKNFTEQERALIMMPGQQWTNWEIGSLHFVHAKFWERHSLGCQRWRWAMEEDVLQGFSIRQARCYEGGDSEEWSNRIPSWKELRRGHSNYGLWRRESWPVCMRACLASGCRTDMEQMKAVKFRNLCKDVYFKAHDTQGSTCPRKLSQR